MNRYATMARAHWQQFLPHQLATMTNPQEFFEKLGQEIADEVETLSRSLAGDDPPGEGYLGKVARLRMSRLQAEEQILSELLPPPEQDEPPAA